MNVTLADQGIQNRTIFLEPGFGAKFAFNRVPGSDSGLEQKIFKPSQKLH